MTPDVANAIGLDKPAGALVAAVSGNSPASSAGVKSGDVITAFNGKLVDTPKALSRDVADVAPGQKATLSVWRDGKSQDLKITIGQNGDDTQTADNSGSAAPDTQPGVKVAELGLGLSNITPDVRQTYNLADEGCLTQPASPATTRPGSSGAVSRSMVCPRHLRRTSRSNGRFIDKRGCRTTNAKHELLGLSRLSKVQTAAQMAPSRAALPTFFRCTRS